MKKWLFTLAFCVVLTLSLVACGGEKAKPTTEAPSGEDPVEEMSIMFNYVTFDAEGMINLVDPTEDMLFVTGLFNGLGDLVNVEIPDRHVVVELPPDLYESDIFTPYAEGMSAIRCEPEIHTHPGHSVVVLTVAEGTDVEAVRADIEANANPKKFICTSAEQVNVVASGNTILLVMSTPEVANTIVSNFFAKLEG